jgi:CRISPR-associated endonuclease/helicase Cas3
VPFRLRRITDAKELVAAEHWRVEAAIVLDRSEEGDAAWLLIESVAEQAAGSEEGRSGAKRAQELDEHHKWTEAAAKRIADALSLEDEFAEALTVAARLHDEGKRAECWQRAFHAPAGGKPYAKTTRRPNLALLNGYRHEFGSLPYAESNLRLKALPPPLRQLALHLIAAHHGWARPLIRTSGTTEPPSRLVQRAQDVVMRFSYLQETWGPWGLAWWEALLRAADQQASRLNDLKGGHTDG